MWLLSFHVFNGVAVRSLRGPVKNQKPVCLGSLSCWNTQCCVMHQYHSMVLLLQCLTVVLHTQLSVFSLLTPPNIVSLCGQPAKFSSCLNIKLFSRRNLACPQGQLYLCVPFRTEPSSLDDTLAVLGDIKPASLWTETLMFQQFPVHGCLQLCWFLSCS